MWRVRFFSRQAFRRHEKLPPALPALHVRPTVRGKREYREAAGREFLRQGLQVLTRTGPGQLARQRMQTRIVADQHDMANLRGDLADTSEQPRGRGEIEGVLVDDLRGPLQMRQDEREGLTRARGGR